MALFIRECWYAVAWSAEVTPGNIHSTKAIGQSLAVCRAADGVVTVLEDRCCHRSAPLSKGRLHEDGSIRCMYHGWRFARDGQCVEVPGQDNPPTGACIRFFPSIESNGWIWAWMGEALEPDSSLIPDVVGPSTPGWSVRTADLEYRAHYQLLHDNLTDLSHLTFLHEKTFGASGAFAANQPNVSLLGEGVHLTRWLPVGGFKVPGLTGKFARGDVEIWQWYDFVLPGVLRLCRADFRPGSIDHFGGRAPPLEEALTVNRVFVTQIVTPITESITKFYCATAVRQSDTSEAEADTSIAALRPAFEEDRQMIEAQHDVILASPGIQRNSANDLASQLMRTVISTRLALESSHLPAGVARRGGAPRFEA